LFVELVTVVADDWNVDSGIRLAGGDCHAAEGRRVVVVLGGGGVGPGGGRGGDGLWGWGTPRNDEFGGGGGHRVVLVDRGGVGDAQRGVVVVNNGAGAASLS